ncbi:MAG: hypothetical protein H6715_02650 [Myxococcales bacterium]|nr:hypothetical protein [Myxococcales bacterium]
MAHRTLRRFVFSRKDIGEVGFDNLLESFSRSYGQFQETIPWTSFVTRLASALAYPLVATAGVAWVSSRRSLYLLVPALVSVVPVARFSRGMFIPAAVFVLTASIASPRKKHSVAIGVFAVCCVLGFIMGARLRHQSEGFGLASIVDYYSGSAQTESDEASSLLRDLLVSTNVMPITSMVFQVGVRAEGDQTLGYLLSQLPIPSFLLPQWIPYTSLSYDLGWFGSGYPYPLIGELWVFFGWWGALLFWLIGMVCAKIDARVKWGGINTRYDYVTCALYGAMLYFSFRSFHSGMRSALRPLVYLALIGIVIRYSHSRLAERNISPTIQRAH